MQSGREGRDDFISSGDLFPGFGGFGGFGSHRSMMSNIFEGRDPFDDPFFTRPFGSTFGSMFGPSGSAGYMSETPASKGIVIEELNSDDEGGEEKEVEDSGAKNDKRQIRSGSSKEPSVEHPEDNVDGKKSKQVQQRSDNNKTEGTQPHDQSFFFRKVTYGGLNGAYYTSSTTRRTGSDGLILEESREADKTAGQAAHRISRGIHDKGHSVIRKLNPDGNVATAQTLHNLNEGELAGFEEAWKGNVDKQLRAWNDEFNIHEDAGASSGGQRSRATWDGWALPSITHSGRARGPTSNNELRTDSSRSRPKKVVTINIE